MSIIKKATMFIVSIACVAALGGCAGRGYLSDSVDDAGVYTITADDAAKGAAVASLGGGLDIEEGEILAISPELEKGSLQVTLLDEGGETALDVTASGTAASEHELEPGEYSISVSCNEDGTTGTLTVAPQAK